MLPSFSVKKIKINKIKSIQEIKKNIYRIFQHELAFFCVKYVFLFQFIMQRIETIKKNRSGVFRKSVKNI